MEDKFYPNKSAEKFIYYFVLYTPVWWALGVIPFLGTILVLWLTLNIRKYSLELTYVSILWWAVSFSQAVSVLINWYGSGQGLGFLFHKLLSAPVSGWFFLGAALAIGCAYNLRSERIVRVSCVLGFYILLFGSISIWLYFFSGLASLQIQTPLASFFPSDLPSVSNFFTMKFYKTDELFGLVLPRLTLFYQWAVMLGFTGIGIFFIALIEKNLFWKVLGLLGGIVGVFFSLSRAALVAFLISLVVYFGLKINTGLKWLLLALISVFSIILLNIEFPLKSIIQTKYSELRDARAGSSDAREQGYDASLDGFLSSPLIGKGWPGEHISKDIPMPIGSHSSVYGVLYTGGLLTFIPFLLAIFATLLALFRKAFAFGSMEASAAVIFLSLAVLCYGEGIYSFVLSELLIFFWIGSALNDSCENGK